MTLPILEPLGEFVERGAGDGRAMKVRKFFGIGNRLDLFAQTIQNSIEPGFQRFKDVLLLRENQAFLAALLATFLAELFGE